VKTVSGPDQGSVSNHLPVSGHCQARFTAVREAFAANFSDQGEVGAALTVYLAGEAVVELVGGWRDADRTEPWQQDTLVNVYSVGKAIVALLLLQLVDRGEVDLDDPVASMWPEFGAEGKAGVTIRQALCHQAGVPAIREPLTNDDLWRWDRMTTALAATEPWWPAGTRHAYHTNTFGHLVGELVHRGTGQLPGECLRTLIAPLDADMWIGVPPAEHHRCAEVIWAIDDRPPTVDREALTGDDLMAQLGYFNPPGYSSMGVVNTPEWRTAQIPSTNGHATATAIARIYAALLEPGRLLSPELLAEATRPQSVGFCPVLGEEVAFGLGFKPTTPRRPFGPNPGGFGHFGTGGALGFADPQAGIAFGYVMNHVIPRWQSTRNRSLIDALYRCLQSP
jgi:CubicO group peptidase (beta-lactamase class C family)